jgi:hypothetical protein
MELGRVYDYVVVGTGVSSYSAVRYLVDKGKDVLVLDRGKTLEFVKSEKIRKFSSIHLKQVSEFDKEQLYQRIGQSDKSIRTLFGSDFPYDRGELQIEYSEDVRVRSSSSLGGFSKIWGATFLPMAFSDINLYPPSVGEEFLELFSEISREVGVIGEGMDLQAIFPSIPCTEGPRNDSKLQYKTRRMKSLLVDDSIGFAKLAVKGFASEKRFAEGCIKCNLCHVGCIYGHVWSSDKWFIHNLEKYSYKSVFVHSLESDVNGWRVRFLDSENQQGYAIGRRIILGAGPIGTSAILLRSKLGLNEIKIKDSQTYFCLGFSQENMSSISGRLPLAELISMQVQANNICSQLQIYGESPGLTSRFGMQLPNFLSRLPERLPKIISGRLVAALLYLDEEMSGSLKVTQSGGRVRVTNEINNLSDNLRKSIRKHNEKLGQLGIYFHPYLVRKLGIGEGNHIGASMPCTWNADELNSSEVIWSDSLGQPKGISGIHVVDASTLKRVPVGSQSLAIMANARRIARALD